MIREGSIRIPFNFAAGEAASAFLVALRDDGRLLGSRCPDCRRVAVPPRGFCGGCGGDDPVSVEVGPQGTLVAWTEQPGQGVFGLVRLDDCDGALLHRLLSPPSLLFAGARVRPRFAGERRGDIRDIAGFEVIEGAEA